MSQSRKDHLDSRSYDHCSLTAASWEILYLWKHVLTLTLKLDLEENSVSVLQSSPAEIFSHFTHETSEMSKGCVFGPQCMCLWVAKETVQCSLCRDSETFRAVDICKTYWHNVSLIGKRSSKLQQWINCCCHWSAMFNILIICDPSSYKQLSTKK